MAWKTFDGAGKLLVSFDLPNSGVVGGTYGDATHVAQIRIDAAGRIVNATNVPILLDTFITKTYAEAATLISTSSLQESATYYISDKYVFLTAVSNKAFSNNGISKSHNADYNNSTGRFLGVWKGTVLVEYTLTGGSFQQGELINCSGGGQLEALRKVAVNIVPSRFVATISTNGTLPAALETMTGVNSGATGTIIAVTTTSILGTIATNKIVAWNNIHYVSKTGSATIKHPKYDTTNWREVAITDTSYPIMYDPIVYNWATASIVGRQDIYGNIVIDKSATPNSIDRFQWGNSSCFGNTILSFDFTGWNACTAQNNIFIQDGGCYIGDTANFSFGIAIGRSTINMMGASDALAAYSNHGNITLYAGLARHAEVYNFGDLTLYDANTVASDSTFIQTNTVLKGTGSIYNCKIDGGPAKIQKIFNNEIHTSQVYKRDVSSTFETTLTQTNVSATLTLPTDVAGNSDIYGVYNTTITGGSANISAIGSMPNAMPVTILMKGANNIVLVNGATIKVKGGANKTFNPANEDWFQLQLLNGATKEVNSGQY